MRDLPRPSKLIVLIGATGVIAAAAVGSAGANRDVSRAGRKGAASACPPAVIARHHAISLNLRCAHPPSRPAAGSPGRAAS